MEWVEKHYDQVRKEEFDTQTDIGALRAEIGRSSAEGEDYRQKLVALQNRYD